MMFELQKFLYWRGHNHKQEFVHGYIYTREITIATQFLLKQGIFPDKFKIQWRLTRSTRLASHTTITFYRQLSALLRAGISLTQALQTLAMMQKDFFQKLLLSLRMHIEVGNSFYASLTQHPRHFDHFSCQLIQIAENTGTLDLMLDQIANHHQKKKTLSDKIKQSLLYPILILVSAIVITFVMLVFVVPQFEGIFADFNAPLPAMTLFVIHLSRAIRQFYWLLIVPFFLIYTIRHFYYRSLKFKLKIQDAIFSLPVLFKLLQTYFSAKFAHALSLMLSAGIPISNALILIEKLSLSQKSAFDIQQLQIKITKGFSLHHAMQASSLFSPLMLQMVKVGEESGMLSAMLHHVAELHDAELQHITQQLTQLLEPLIIIMLGVLIGSLVISMYLPIFKLGTVM